MGLYFFFFSRKQTKQNYLCTPLFIPSKPCFIPFCQIQEYQPDVGSPALDLCNQASPATLDPKANCQKPKCPSCQLLCYKPNSDFSSDPSCFLSLDGDFLAHSLPSEHIHYLRLCGLQGTPPSSGRTYTPPAQCVRWMSSDRARHTHSIPLSFGRTLWRSRWKIPRTLNSPDSFSEFLSPH